jgi:predicted RNA-binding protein
LAASGVAAVDKSVHKGATVALMTAGKELIGLGTAQKSGEEIAAAKKGIVVKTTTVVMPRDHYPRKWTKK